MPDAETEMFVNKLQEKRVFYLTLDPVSIDACSHTEIWDSTAAYKKRLEHENRILVRTPKCSQKKIFIFFAHENMKKLRSKVAHNRSKTFFDK